MKSQTEAAKVLLDGGTLIVVVNRTLETTFEMKLSDIEDDDDMDSVAEELALAIGDWYETDVDVLYR